MYHPPLRALETKSAALELKEEGEPDVPAAIAELTRTVTEQITGLRDEVKAAKERADALETKLDRPGRGDGGEAAGGLERKAFFDYARRGREHLPADEVKVLRVADDVAGGYIVAPDTFLDEVLKELADISPMRTLARVKRISTGGVTIPRRLTGPKAWWVDEIEDRSKTDKTFGQARIVTHEAASFIDVSQQLLEDSAVDLEAELREDFADAFAELESDAFINGDGIKEPSGFMVDPLVQNVASGNANALTADSLIDLFYALPAATARKATWCMNRKTMGVVRKLKDANGQYLWQPGLQAGQPATILGRPVEEFGQLDDVEAGKRPIALGDFDDAYRIFDRVRVSVLRDPYTQATKGLVRFHFRRRVGGGVVKPDAIRTLKITAAL